MEVFQCCICWREFGSRQAMHGHLRVHALRKHQELDKKQPVNWASTDKRGTKGSKAVIARFAPKDEVGNSVTNVVAEPVLPFAPPIAVARTNLSGSQGSSSAVIAPKDEVGNSMAIVVVEPVLPIAQPITHQQAAAAPYAATNHHSPPQPAATLPQLLLLPRAAQGDQASGPPYRCKVCNREFLKGVALGGHMRKHYPGKLIIQKQKQKQKKQHGIRLSLSLAPPTTEVAPPALAPATVAAALPPAPAPAPIAPTRIVRIFGYDYRVPSGSSNAGKRCDWFRIVCVVFSNQARLRPTAPPPGARRADRAPPPVSRLPHRHTGTAAPPPLRPPGSSAASARPSGQPGAHGTRSSDVDAPDVSLHRRPHHVDLTGKQIRRLSPIPCASPHKHHRAPLVITRHVCYISSGQDATRHATRRYHLTRSSRNPSRHRCVDRPFGTCFTDRWALIWLSTVKFGTRPFSSSLLNISKQHHKKQQQQGEDLRCCDCSLGRRRSRGVEVALCLAGTCSSELGLELTSKDYAKELPKFCSVVA
ncbi:hypothetical protein ABZP36_015167 [Zizania latifolia]